MTTQQSVQWQDGDRVTHPAHGTAIVRFGISGTFGRYLKLIHAYGDATSEAGLTTGSQASLERSGWRREEAV